MDNTIIKVKQGDNGTDAALAFTLTDPDGTITSLAGRSIYLLVFTVPDSPVLNKACVFDTGMTFHYVPGTTDFSFAPGLYSYEIEINGIATGKLSGSTGTFIMQPSPVHT